MKLKRILIIIVTLIFAILLLGNVKSYAAKGSFSISKSSVTLTKGKSTTFKITAKNCGGKFTVTSSNTKVATVSSSKPWVESGSVSITIKAKAKGTATIKVTASNVGDTSENDVTGTKSIKVTVKDSTTSSSSSSTSNSNTKPKQEKTKSKDATLKNLGITPYDFSGFRKMTTSYSVTVPDTVKTIKIYAYATDSKAKVTGTGTKKLNNGVNTFSIKVTAEDKKTTKTYTLKITKKKEEEKPEEEKPEQEETTENKQEENNKEKNEQEENKSLEITGLTLTPMFENEIYEYNVNAPIDTKALDIKTELSDYESYYIETTGNENLQPGENLINLLVRNKKNDDVITTYQIVANIQDLEVDLTEVNNSIKEAEKAILLKRYIIIGTIAIIIVLIIIFLIQRYKLRNEYKKQEEVEETKKIENEEETVDNYKEEEIKKKTNKTKKKKGNHFK